MELVEFQCISHTFSTLGVDDYWNDNNFGQKCQCVMLRLACSCGTHSRSRLSLAAKYVSKPLELKVLSGIDSNSKGNICGACGYSLFFQFAHWLACLLVRSTTKLSSLLFVRYQSMSCKKNVHFDTEMIWGTNKRLTPKCSTQTIRRMQQ